jgi:hypothetical protein
MNFLFLVNHDASAKTTDLDRVLTGYADSRHGLLEATCVQYAGGRISEEKRKIDLYVWLDVEADGSISARAYRVLGNQETRLWVCGLLGIEPEIVKNIQAAA